MIESRHREKIKTQRMQLNGNNAGIRKQITVINSFKKMLGK